MANTLRINPHKEDIYVIEVNDDGETIEFDLGDISLPIRANDAFRNVERILYETRQQVAGMTDTIEITKVYNKMYMDMREAMDGFLGQGACQKIFGNRNYVDMFTDLWDALTPHMEKMKITMNGIEKRIAEKYSATPEEAAVLE